MTLCSRVIVPSTTLCAWGMFLPNASEQQRVALMYVDACNGAAIGTTGGCTTGIRIVRGHYAAAGSLIRNDALGAPNAFAGPDLYYDGFTQDVRTALTLPLPIVPDTGYGGLTIVIWTSGTAANATLLSTVIYSNDADVVHYDYRMPGATRKTNNAQPTAQGAN